MNNKILSDESLIEDYEDLVFKKVFAIRCAEESKIIFDEIRKRENTETAGKKIVEKLFNKKEYKENFQTLGKIFKKGFVFAASLVFVVIVSVSSVVVASADIREVVTDIIYHLVFEENEKYTKISVAEDMEFIDPELYDWDGAYAPTYMPEGFACFYRDDLKYYHAIGYSKGNKEIYIAQFTDNSYKVDTENALEIQYVEINGSEAAIIKKHDYSAVCWSSDNSMFWVYGNCEEKELLKIAQSMKKLK